jgi:uncharacterized membrane protein YgcG
MTLCSILILSPLSLYAATDETRREQAAPIVGSAVQGPCPAGDTKVDSALKEKLAVGASYSARDGECISKATLDLLNLDESYEAKKYLLSLNRAPKSGCKTASDESIGKLSPQFSVCAAKFIKAYTQSSGVKMSITSAFRTPEQQSCVCQGETGMCGAPGKLNPKTGIVEGGSNHQRGIALDINPSDRNYEKLHGFAKSNPNYGISFPHGMGDRVHIQPNGNCKNVKSSKLDGTVSGEVSTAAAAPRPSPFKNLRELVTGDEQPRFTTQPQQPLNQGLQQGLGQGFGQQPQQSGQGGSGSGSSGGGSNSGGYSSGSSGSSYSNPTAPTSAVTPVTPLSILTGLSVLPTSTVITSTTTSTTTIATSSISTTTLTLLSTTVTEISATNAINPSTSTVVTLATGTYTVYPISTSSNTFVQPSVNGEVIQSGVVRTPAEAYRARLVQMRDTLLAVRSLLRPFALSNSLRTAPAQPN